MKFSDFCYFGILDNDFNVLSSDKNIFFQKLKDGGVNIKKRLRESKDTDRVTYGFKSKGVHYLVTLERAIDNYLLCSIREEIPPEYADDESLFRDIDDIEDGSLSVLSMALTVKNYLNQPGMLDIDDPLLNKRNENTSVYSDYINVLNLFCSKTAASYIQLRKYLIHSADVLNFSAKPLMKWFNFTINISPPYVKIDYNKLLLALQNLAKLSLFCTCQGASSYIGVSSYEGNRMKVTLRAPLQQNVFLDRYRVEIRSVKHSFKLLGGRFDFFEQDGCFCGSGCFPAASTWDVNALDPDKTINFVTNFRDILKAREKGEYKNLFCHYKKGFLYSDVTEFREVEMREVFETMRFFGI